ncbi:MAG: hypothetical protein FRX49_05866 [Trebouxia sp. A1-2]|nr:MAG: hypothetical protein FRX49_05866 [Trebouxia sp. A1-2]
MASMDSRRNSGDHTTRPPLADVLNHCQSSKSRGESSKHTPHSNCTEPRRTAQLAYSQNDRKLPEDGSLEIAQASRSATGSQDCLSMQKLQQTQLTELTGSKGALTPQPAMGAAASASAEASVASKAEPESASAGAAKADEPAHAPEQLVDLPVVKALLRRDDRQQLQHVFRLGAQHSIKRFLRISFSGHLLGQPSGLHSVRQLSVTAPATLPAGCSTPSTQALSNSSLPNAAGHRVDRHPPKQLQQQQTVTQPLRSVHHAGHSEAAAALLQTGAREDVTDAGGQPTADCRVAFDALCGSIKSRPGHVESSSMTRSVGTHEKPEVSATGRRSQPSPPLIALDGR